MSINCEIMQNQNIVKEPEMENCIEDMSLLVIQDMDMDAIQETNAIKEIDEMQEVKEIQEVNEIHETKEVNEIRAEIRADGVLCYLCPHCGGSIETGISEIACGIFRHGFNLQTNCQINPHESKELCESYVNNPNYIGCCKPYQIVKKEEYYSVNVCGWI